MKSENILLSYILITRMIRNNLRHAKGLSVFLDRGKKKRVHCRSAAFSSTSCHYFVAPIKFLKVSTAVYKQVLPLRSDRIVAGALSRCHRYKCPAHTSRNAS